MTGEVHVFRWVLLAVLAWLVLLLTLAALAASCLFL